MRKHKNGDFIECTICGSILQYNDNKIDTEIHHNSGTINTILKYIKCPECQSLIFIEKEIHGTKFED